MYEEEALQEIERLSATISDLATHWDQRAPTLLASSLGHYSIPTVLEIIARTPETPAEDELHHALAKMILARFAKEDGRLDEFRSELWEVVNANDARLPVLRSLLRQIQDIAVQQPRSHPSREAYQAIRLLSDEVLLELRNRPLQPTPRRRRRAAIKLAHTAELPELSQLTLEAADKLIVPKRQTQTLSALPASVALPPLRPVREQLIDPELLPECLPDIETLLQQLPPLFALLEQWDDDSTPFALAERLQTLSIREILRLSALLIPHPQQESFLRYVSIFLHLRFLSDIPLPHLTEELRLLVSEPDPVVKRILTAVLYYLYCSSHSFFAIQEQALKRIENQQQSYLYHRIAQEWTANKLMRNFLRASLTRPDQHTVKNLSPFDWEYIFFILNRGWARSVMRDVYGVFHGNSVFANQIVLPDTSKGFGALNETGRGVSLTLATRQISDLLISHSKIPAEDSLRASHIEQFLQERWRKDVLRKEQRPTLNAPTLKRIERFVQQIFQRGQSDQLSGEYLASLITRECLQAFAYLPADRLPWFLYELAQFLLRETGQNTALLHEVCAGMLGGLIQVFVQELQPRRPQEAALLLDLAWEGWYGSLLDHCGLHLQQPELIEALRADLLARWQALLDQYLEPARAQFFTRFTADV